MKTLQTLGILAVATSLSSCTMVQTRVMPKDRALESSVRTLVQNQSLPSAILLDQARRTTRNDEQRLSLFLEAARTSMPGALRGNVPDKTVYDAALREVVIILKGKKFDDQTLTNNVKSNFPTRSLTTDHRDRKGKFLFDPENAEVLVPASQVQFRGLNGHAVQSGFGVPYVAWMPKSSPFLKGQPGIPPSGMAIPLTAILEFSETKATLRFVQTLDQESIIIEGKTRALAGDFSAPLALLLSKGKNRAIDIGALLRTDAYLDRAALLQFQPYNPDKIPVIFVHGLLSRPEAWAKALNTLLEDPTMRSKYQFWFFIYPTGLPVWHSAAILRSEMVRFDKTLDPNGRNPLMKEKVLIGHSMGGIISSLLVRKGGNYLWSQFSEKSLEDLEENPELKQRVQEMVFFEPRNDVDRVIYVATPHRGSPLALRSAVGFFAGLIRLPTNALEHDRTKFLSIFREDMRSVFQAPANSVRILRSNSPILLSVLNLPMARDIPYHSIIGNRGRQGPIKESSDGVVPYWSSHLDGATSETIVPSGHGANENPEGIAEIQRILRQNAGLTP